MSRISSHSAGLCFTAALALLSCSVSAPALAATTVTHFQQENNLDCTGNVTCYANFAVLPSNQTLDVKHISCLLVVTGKAYYASAFYDPGPKVTVQLGLIWERTASVQRYYFFRGGSGPARAARTKVPGGVGA